MSRSEIFLPLVCLILLGSAAVFSARSSAPAPSQTVEINPRAKARSSPLAAAGTTDAEAQEHAVLAATRPPTAVVGRAGKISNETAPDLTSSSWENPFSEQLWRASGWEFTTQGMRTDGTGAASATFYRSYHRLMFECDILGGNSAESRWELKLTTKGATSSMSFIIQDGHMSIVATEKTGSRILVNKELTAPVSRTEPRQFRLVATGNRIVISWDHKRFLTTDQLAAQSGKEVVWSIHSAGAAFAIPALRVEGD